MSSRLLPFFVKRKGLQRCRAREKERKKQRSNILASINDEIVDFSGPNAFDIFSERYTSRLL